MTPTGMSEKLNQLTELPVSEFVIHRKPMFLLDRLVSLEPDSAVCEWRVQNDNAFLIDGSGVPAYIGIEYMAQCVAVHGGACERAHGFPPPQGMLLGTRHFHSEVPFFTLGTTYQVKCMKLMSNMEGMGSFQCSILLNDQVIAEARVSILQESQGELFNE